MSRRQGAKGLRPVAIDRRIKHAKKSSACSELCNADCAFYTHKGLSSRLTMPYPRSATCSSSSWYWLRLGTCSGHSRLLGRGCGWLETGTCGTTINSNGYYCPNAGAHLAPYSLVEVASLQIAGRVAIDATNVELDGHLVWQRICPRRPTIHAKRREHIPLVACTQEAPAGAFCI
jgi:hypothetical protein